MGQSQVRARAKGRIIRLGCSIAQCPIIPQCPSIPQGRTQTQAASPFAFFQKNPHLIFHEHPLLDLHPRLDLVNFLVRFFGTKHDFSSGMQFLAVPCRCFLSWQNSHVSGTHQFLRTVNTENSANATDNLANETMIFRLSEISGCDPSEFLLLRQYTY